jgi:manganese transport protein
MPIDSLSTLTDRTRFALSETLAGRRHGLRGMLALSGPALVASVAYVDPGNYIANIQAGARYGYALLWVVLLANVIAMFFQAQAARLGIVTGRNLAELSRERFSPPVAIAMWILTELAAMATDLAEFVGGAVGLSLLLHVGLLVGMAAMGVLTMLLLTMQRRGFRPLEILITSLVSVISVSYLGELLIAPANWGSVLRHSLVPSLPDAGAVTLCISLVGATVMPHAIYLHSSLTQNRVAFRDDGERARMIRYSDREVVFALTVAGLVNMAMVVVAACFHGNHSDIATLEGTFHTLTPLLGRAAALIFLVSLLASGLSSSLVATMAGQVVMQGFVGFHVPIWVRRVATMAPSFVVIALGVDVTRALIWSQVVLSFVLPLPMITLLMIARDARVMGRFRMSKRVLAVTGAMVGFVCVLNAVLLLQTAGVLPG